MLAAGSALALAGLAMPALATPASAGILSATTSPYIVTDLGSTTSSSGTTSLLSGTTSLLGGVVSSVGGVLGGGAGPSAASSVSAVGGQVVQSLDAASSVEANLTPLQVSLLSATPGVVLTPDVTINVASDSSDPPHTGSDAFTSQTGATQDWAQGDTGAGVNVAVLDTGIDPLADFANRLMGGVDLSGGNNPYRDSYGHGTFVAGLIAGNGASSGGVYTGEAPGAGLVSIKVAGSSGQTDLATVIAGVGWAITNRTPLDIGVLNMSLGYVPLASTALDPLDLAVESAWNSGIVVVTSAGNAGPFNGTILSPGDDPLVITAGAVDDLGSASTAGDIMAPFSSVGPTSPDGWIKPDLVTSGRSVVSLRAPGSTIDNAFPSARVGGTNFVGSGTSFSAAITSGAAAMVLAANPGDTPNQVKAALLVSATPGPVGNPVVDGHGLLDVSNATAVPTGLTLVQYPSLVAVATGSTVGLSNSWSSSSWDPSNWTWNGQSWNGTSWNGQSWNGQSWNGTSWNGQSWNGTSWNGQSWNGTSWNGQAWNGQAWNGQSWNGTSWNGQSWNGTSWNGTSWNGTSWNGTSWNGQSWNGQSWNGQSWNGSAWN